MDMRMGMCVDMCTEMCLDAVEHEVAENKLGILVAVVVGHLVTPSL